MAIEANKGRVEIIAQSAVAVPLTGTLTETTLATITIPPLGPNDAFKIESTWSNNNSANTKTQRHRFGGTQIHGNTPTTTVAARYVTVTHNRNSVSSQISGNAAGTIGATGAALIATTVNTAAPSTVTITGQLANVADTTALEAYTVYLLRAP